MNFKSFAATALLAMAGAFGAISGAFAAEAAATTALNVRTGPGTNYAVVGALSPNQVVQVGSCQGSWCQVSGANIRGWASSYYLRPISGGGLSGKCPRNRPESTGHCQQRGGCERLEVHHDSPFERFLGLCGKNLRTGPLVPFVPSDARFTGGECLDKTLGNAS